MIALRDVQAETMLTTIPSRRGALRWKKLLSCRPWYVTKVQHISISYKDERDDNPEKFAQRAVARGPASPPR